MTHDELVQLTAKKAEKLFGCGLILREMGSCNVNFIPDVFAVKKGGITFQFEIKVSLKDFLADKKKPHRDSPQRDVGDFRYYVVPKGLIPPDHPDLTRRARWGLIEVTKGGQFEFSKGIDPKGGLGQFQDHIDICGMYHCVKDHRTELELAYASHVRTVLASEEQTVKLCKIVERVSTDVSAIKGILK